MALRRLHSLAHDDEELYDLAKGMPDDYEPAEYPSGMCFSVENEDLEKAGLEGGDVGATTPFSAMAEVTSIYKDMDDCRIELKVTDLAGGDGKLVSLATPGRLCMNAGVLEKMDLDDDCELGDLIHIIGTARLESRSSYKMSDRPWMFGEGEGEEDAEHHCCTLQIIEAAYEDESEEAREG